MLDILDDKYDLVAIEIAQCPETIILNGQKTIREELSEFLDEEEINKLGFLQTEGINFEIEEPQPY